jgi:Tol biopolymer transport system component
MTNFRQRIQRSNPIRKSTESPRQRFQGMLRQSPRKLLVTLGIAGIVGVSLGTVATRVPAVMLAAPCERIGFQQNGPARTSDIWIMDSDGTNKTNLTNNPVGAFSTGPDWSPDGTRLAYIGLPLGAGTFDVFVSDANGGNPKNVTNSPTTNSSLQRLPYGVHWSPDGRRIAFTLATIVNRAGQSFGDVWVMDADGNNQINVTNKESIHGSADFLSWSPDSTRIAINGYGLNYGDIWTVNPNTSNAVQITNTDPAIGTSNSEALFSPDGKQIGYSQRTQYGRFSDVWVADIDGTHHSKITNTTIRDSGSRFAGWSSDGRKIAYSSYNGDGNVWVSDPDGSHPTNITNATAGTLYGNAIWSPMGPRLSFQKVRTVGSPAVEYFRDISVADSSGASVVDLTQNPPNSISLFSQSWVRCSSESSTASSSTTTTSSTSTTSSTPTRIVPEIVGGQTSTTAPLPASTVPITTPTSTIPLALVFPPIPTATTTTAAAQTTPSVPTTPPTTTAAPAPPTFTLNPTTIPNGGTITLTGGGFQPGTEANFELHSTITPLGKTTVNANGTFTYHIPTSAGVEPGNHEVFVFGTNQQGKPTTLSVALSILGPTPTAAPTPPNPAPSVLGTEEVAYTGNSTTAGPITAGAMAMILTGAYLLIHTRRRRN